MEIGFKIIIFVFGLCCGSFVNMLVYRTAVDYELIKSKGIKKKKNVTFIKTLGGRSFCDSCGKQLFWYENIPVISWLIQKGKTRCCHKKLPIQYPIVEIMTGVLFLLNFQFLISNQPAVLAGFQSNLNSFNFQFLIQLLLGFVIIIFLVFSAVFDIKYMILPDFSTVVLVLSGLVLWYFGHFSEWSYVISTIVSFGLLGFLYLITKKKGMGFGDVKLALFMGLFLGKRVILAFYVAFIIGALVAVFLLILKKVDKKTAVPFGPFLILGVLVAWFWGSELISLPIFQFFK